MELEILDHDEIISLIHLIAVHENLFTYKQIYNQRGYIHKDYGLSRNESLILIYVMRYLLKAKVKRMNLKTFTNVIRGTITICFNRKYKHLTERSRFTVNYLSLILTDIFSYRFDLNDIILIDKLLSSRKKLEIRYVENLDFKIDDRSENISDLNLYFGSKNKTRLFLLIFSKLRELNSYSFVVLNLKDFILKQMATRNLTSFLKDPLISFLLD